MEQIKELEEVLELLNTKQYTKLRQYLAELNDADIAGLLELSLIHISEPTRH